MRFDRIMVFAPSPELTVTGEDRGGAPDLHLYAGGQGIWQAQMIITLGVRVALCAAFGGETGAVLQGKPRFVKVSHEELLEDGRVSADSPETLVTVELHRVEGS